MRIDINQKRIAIGDKYRIFLDKIPTYKASTKLFRLMAVIEISKAESSDLILTIKRQWSWFKAKYQIESGNETAEFSTVSIWKLHYRCQFKNQFYDIYGHKGRKFSIFKNDRQVAYIDKEAVTWFEGDNYVIFADDDANKELLMAFCLIIDNYTSKNHQKNTVTYDFGNIGWNLKKFDADWRPKRESSAFVGY
jgi:hypothetical protein